MQEWKNKLSKLSVEAIFCSKFKNKTEQRNKITISRRKSLIKSQFWISNNNALVSFSTIGEECLSVWNIVCSKGRFFVKFFLCKFIFRAKLSLNKAFLNLVRWDSKVCRCISREVGYNFTKNLFGTVVSGQP